MNTVNKNITGFLNQEFPVLDDRSSRWFLVFFCAVFTTIFLIVYNPLNVNEYIVNTRIGTLLSIHSAGFIGAAVLIITQFVFRPLIGLSKHTVLTFSLWLVIELLAISYVLFLIYGEIGQPFWSEVFTTIEKTVMLAIFPYSLACLLLSLYQARQKNIQPTQIPIIREFVTLKDENGKDILTLKSSDLIYLKAENNYVSATYLKNGQIEKTLIRNNLKSLENNLNNPNLLRIHRSYMINKPNINSINRKGRHMVIQMNHVEDTTLPVSSSYKTAIESKMSDLTVN